MSDGGKICSPLHEECAKHRGKKWVPKMTPEIFGVIAERAQVILVWVRAPGVRNATTHKN